MHDDYKKYLIRQLESLDSVTDGATPAQRPAIAQATLAIVTVLNHDEMALGMVSRIDGVVRKAIDLMPKRRPYTHEAPSFADLFEKSFGDSGADR